MAADPDCIFCAIVAGKAPSIRIHEDEWCVAFMDISPATRGHCLVIPREHHRDVHDLPDEDLAACACAGKLLAARAVSELGADGVNLLNSSGVAAWQTVFHFHLHVVPRYDDDPLELPWIPSPGDMDEIRAAGEKLAP